MRFATLLIVLFAACVTGTGCALVAGGLAGVAGHAYVEGAETRVYPQPVRVTAQSVVVSLHRMGIKPKRTQLDDFGGTISAETADGESIKIRIDPEKDGTAVSVRFGTFGDEKKSNALFARLEELLPRAEVAPAVMEGVAGTETSLVPAAPAGAMVLPGESTFAPNAPIPPIPSVTAPR